MESLALIRLEVVQLPSIDLVSLRNGTAKLVRIEKDYEDAEVSARAKGFKIMMEKFMDKARLRPAIQNP